MGSAPVLSSYALQPGATAAPALRDVTGPAKGHRPEGATARIH
jgi:hypothetical protein